MTNIYSLCNDIELFLQQTDDNSRKEFFNWIKYRLNIEKFEYNNNNDLSMINTSQIFICRCGHKYSFRFIIDDIIEQKKFDDLKYLEQLIPPENIEQQQKQQDSNLIEYETTRFGLPKLTDSITEIIHPDGKRQFRCPLCLNSYVNRSGLNRHYITHSSQDLWKVECQFCGKRYSRKDSLKHHMKTQHTKFIRTNLIWKNKNNEKLFQSYKNLLDMESISSSSNEKEQIDNDDIILVN